MLKAGNFSYPVDLFKCLETIKIKKVCIPHLCSIDVVLSQLHFVEMPGEFFICVLVIYYYCRDILSYVGGGSMNWLESWKEERLRKKEDEQELIELYEWMIREYFIVPEYNEAEEIKKNGFGKKKEMNE
jgi:hypothetical protein